ncbi:hypothetical protein RclHR1_01390024 [Rhizophagus clarus]|nr:hypothetical protein RclHR1_01390024 [Rhizophagus clarus]
MINRLWCETAIPILWKNPWCYSGINYKNKNYLFIIIASYLSDDTKKFLTRHGIHLPSVSCKSFLFDYLSFCRSINIINIEIITSIGSSLVYNQFLLQQEFYGLFMKKFPELKYLDMKSIKHQIFYFPEARLRFESLCELECDTSIDSSYFYGLARLCQYIKRLIIFNRKLGNYSGIAKLIEVQRNLKYFEWEDTHWFRIAESDSCKEVLLALTDTINHLKLISVNKDRTLQRVLPKLHKLKSLIINDLYIDNEEQLKMCVYRDLEVFMVDHYNLKTASIIIENTGRRLKKIFLESYELNDYYGNFKADSLIFIRKIHENCPLIEYLCLSFSPTKEHFNELEKLLKVCQYVKLLLIDMVDISRERTEEKFLENGEELLKTLIRSAPTNLREIRFLYDYKFSLKALEEFLEKWKGCSLSILTCEPIYKEEDYVKVINKYKNNGVIKDFICESSTNVENMDENYALPIGWHF